MMTQIAAAHPDIFTYVVCKEVPGRSMAIDKDLLIDRSDSMDGALLKMKTFLSGGFSDIQWSAGERVVVYKTTPCTLLAMKMKETEMVLPNQALLVRVCGNGLKNGNEIVDEETEIHMHNTTPDVVHFFMRSEVISRTSTHHGSWSNEKMKEIDDMTTQFNEKMKQCKENINEADTRVRQEETENNNSL